MKAFLSNPIVHILGLIASLITIYTFFWAPSQNTNQTVLPTWLPDTPVAVSTWTPVPPTLTPTQEPSSTATKRVGSAPIIDSIDIPKTIICDGRRYSIPVRFRDPDGDAQRLQWELLYTKKNTTLYTTAKEFIIDKQTQISGATYVDFIQWYIPGDEVKIRVHIQDREGLIGSADFEFKCSP
jgi:hypothetical protein